MEFSITRLKKIVRDIIVDNHKTTVMSLKDDKLLKTLSRSSIEALTKNIMERSPLFVFATMSLPGFFVSNRYIVKNESFNSEEQDLLIALLENIRLEFGSSIIMDLLDKDSIPKDAFETMYKDKKLVAAYIFALYKDMIMIEAENAAFNYLSSLTQIQNQESKWKLLT